MNEESVDLNSSELDDPTFVPSAAEQVDKKVNPDMENIFRNCFFYLMVEIDKQSLVNKHLMKLGGHVLL